MARRWPEKGKREFNPEYIARFIHGLLGKVEMKARLNNTITKYEAERERLRMVLTPRPMQAARLSTVNEVLKILYELRR